MATTLSEIPRTYEEAVQSLADWHGTDSRRRDVEIWAFRGDDDVVRLLEISPSHASLGEAWPVGFNRTEDFPFFSQLILVSPQEWQRIESGEMPLPANWDLARKERVWPRAA